MSIEHPDELTALRAVGQVVARTLRAMRAAAVPGTTTGELDDVAARIFDRAGARSGPRLDYGFPRTTCISVNDEAVHGVPGARRLRDGDLVKLDVTAELDGFYADACTTVSIGRGRPRDRKLAATATRALSAGMAAARAGAPVNAIGAAVEGVATHRGAAVCADLAGHGIGRRIHEEPNVPSVFVPGLDQPLTDGLVLTIEPILAAGAADVYCADDGWTYKTADGSRVAHAEHTIVIRDGAPLILTA